MNGATPTGRPGLHPGPAPATGAQPATRKLRLRVAAERLHSMVQPRFLTTLLAVGSTLGALSVVLAWVLS